jgi:hypothetical protein
MAKRFRIENIANYANLPALDGFRIDRSGIKGNVKPK